MAEADVHYTADGMKRGIDVLVQGDSDLLKSITEKKAQLKDLAQMCMDVDDKAKAADFRKMFQDLLSMEHEVSLHMSALDGMKSTYKASAEASDFGGQMQKKMEMSLASHKFEPELSDDLKSFDKDTGLAVSAGDDDVIDESRAEVANNQCPLSLKSVFKLDEAVTDRMGIIYEKKAVVDYLRQHGRNGQPVVCPVAGASHTLTVGSLKPAMQLERAKRRRMINQGAAGGSKDQVQEYDVDDE
ncbi:hypothetical protein FOA52_013886 [Chlamydomonas sp. UWO 241]|nr:hypothetical protein FOA52_013886 [Chlamydomonas sp. UWO 241]